MFRAIRWQVLLLALCAGGADAANLLTNGDFPMSVPVGTGWAFDPDVALDWDPLDRFGGGNGSDPSGSMRVTTDFCSLPCEAPVASSAPVCFVTAPGQSLQVRGSIFVPVQAASPEGRIQVRYFDRSPFCQSSDFVGFGYLAATSATSRWVDFEETLIVPGGVSGVQLWLVVYEESQPAAVVHFDALYLPESHGGALAVLALFALRRRLGGTSRRAHA